MRKRAGDLFSTTALPWPSHLTHLLSKTISLRKCVKEWVRKCKSMGGYGMVFNLLKIKSQNRLCFKYVFFFDSPDSWPENRRLKKRLETHLYWVNQVKSVQNEPNATASASKGVIFRFYWRGFGVVDSWTRGWVYVRVRWAWGPLSDQVCKAYSTAALFHCSCLPSYITPSSSPTHLHIDLSQNKIFLLMHHHVQVPTHFLSHHCPSIQWVSNDEIRSDTFSSTLVVSHSWPR